MAAALSARKTNQVLKVGIEHSHAQTRVKTRRLLSRTGGPQNRWDDHEAGKTDQNLRRRAATTATSQRSRQDQNATSVGRSVVGKVIAIRSSDWPRCAL